MFCYYLFIFLVSLDKVAINRNGEQKSTIFKIIFFFFTHLPTLGYFAERVQEL